MKNIKLIQVLLIVLGSIILNSCEEVIEIDLNSSNPKLVAEGQILKDSTVWIKLSYTSDYFTNEKAIFEENASIVITDNDNNTEVLNYVGDGIYKGENLIGEVGKNYRMNISTEKGDYTASSNLMPSSEIYDIIVSESEMQRPGQKETKYSLEIKFKHNPATEDYFLLKFYINNKLNSYALVDDKVFVVGDTIQYPVIKKSFFKNDRVTVKIYSVDKEAFKYHKQINDAASKGGRPGSSSTPYNPASNFGIDVLGYFTAWSYVSDSVIIE